MGAKKRPASQRAAAATVEPEPTDIQEEEVREIDPPARAVAFKYQDSVSSPDWNHDPLDEEAIARIDAFLAIPEEERTSQPAWRGIVAPARLWSDQAKLGLTVSYEVLFNGAPLRQFQPKCGLRQGDPLSPFLFILCMEVLSHNIGGAERDGILNGISLGRNSISISHLFFADDSVFFLKDKHDAFSRLKKILDDYCIASGQVINMMKSGIVFSPSTTMLSATNGLKILGINHHNGIGKYLGIVADVGASKSIIFNNMIDNVKRRLSSWNGIFLSQAGRLTLINSVLSSLSNFILSVFKIPGCRSILHGAELILPNLGWQFSSDSPLNVWSSKWIDGLCPSGITSFGFQHPSSMSDLLIKDLVLPSLAWNKELINEIFEEDWAIKICAMPICHSVKNDYVYWVHSPTGEYSVKSGYAITLYDHLNKFPSAKDWSRINPSSKVFCKRKLWHLPGPHTWKILVWRIISGTLSVGSEFARRKISVEYSCPLCRNLEAMETRNHLFRDCVVVKRLWAASPLGINTDNVDSILLGDWLINWFSYFSSLDDASTPTILFLSVLWSIWCTRNNIIFRDAAFSVDYFFNLQSNIAQTAITAMNLPCPQVPVGRTWEEDVAYDGNGSELTKVAYGFAAETALQAEATGIRDLLAWALRSNFLHFDVSSDCLQILQIAGVEKPHHKTSGLINDINLLLASFHCICFSYIPGNLNKVAHNLARNAMGL
ncbi:uncharacterized protein LOC141649814 [Silene latifolia]|uniref:uncharacterized protein LOC141649814 n=1 Tax=Silene latifolia TaxID=37657 RepID=UPI003D7842FD